MKILKATLITSALVLSTSANAALVERLDGLAYYDDVADLTWLADANYALTSGYDDNGFMQWADANSWAAGLDIGGVTGWRLAHTDASCGGTYAYNCTDSEMGNLFYNVLGGSEGSSIDVTHNSNYDLFSDIQTTDWTATEYAAIPDTYAWAFLPGSGGEQTPFQKTYYFNAWAVQSGDVSAVPVPAAVWLFGSGLIGLIGLTRRKKA